MISPNTAAVQEEQQPRFLLKELIYLNIIPVFVRDGDHADTFIISTKQESREKRRQKVLDKLTAEERELLGV